MSLCAEEVRSMIEVVTTQGISGRDYSYLDVRGPVSVVGRGAGCTITTEVGSYHTEHAANKVTTAILKARQEPNQITRVQA